MRIVRGSIAFCAGSVRRRIRVRAAETWLINADKIYTDPKSPADLKWCRLGERRPHRGVADERSRIAIPQTASVSRNAAAWSPPVFRTATFISWKPRLEGCGARCPRRNSNAPLEAMLTRYGFTTVFDTGSDQANTIAMRDAHREGRDARPTHPTAGLPLYPPDGIPF